MNFSNEKLVEYFNLTKELEKLEKEMYDYFCTLTLEQKLKLFLEDTFPLDKFLKKEHYIFNFEKESWERRVDYFEFVERYQIVSLDDIYKHYQNYY